MPWTTALYFPPHSEMGSRRPARPPFGYRVKPRFSKMHGQNFKNVHLQFSRAANGSWKSVEVSGSQWRWLQLSIPAECEWWILMESDVKVGTHSSHPFIEIKKTRFRQSSVCPGVCRPSQTTNCWLVFTQNSRQTGWADLLHPVGRINTRQSWEFSDTKDKRDKNRGDKKKKPQAV